jgi:HAD superfamily hydrolase (TIGR01490 family)
MKLALFDLDHTLIAFDSGMAWIDFLVARGVLPGEAAHAYRATCRGYLAGTQGIRDLHRACVAPTAGYTRAQMQPWQQAFEQAMAPRVPAAMRRLVDAHRAAGDLCAIVTATTRFVAEPFARLFGIAHLVATEAEWRDGHADGAVAGEPCHREHKPAHVARWLAGSARTLGDFAQSCFYSDTLGDLPLLEAVSHPVAVAPDAALRAHALARGWRVIERQG